MHLTTCQGKNTLGMGLIESGGGLNYLAEYEYMNSSNKVSCRKQIARHHLCREEF